MLVLLVGGRCPGVGRCCSTGQQPPPAMAFLSGPCLWCATGGCSLQLGTSSVSGESRCFAGLDWTVMLSGCCHVLTAVHTYVGQAEWPRAGSSLHLSCAGQLPYRHCEHTTVPGVGLLL